jgi:hypothetical protein
MPQVTAGYEAVLCHLASGFHLPSWGVSHLDESALGKRQVGIQAEARCRLVREGWFGSGPEAASICCATRSRFYGCLYS